MVEDLRRPDHGSSQRRDLRMSRVALHKVVLVPKSIKYWTNISQQNLSLLHRNFYLYLLCSLLKLLLELQRGLQVVIVFIGVRVVLGTCVIAVLVIVFAGSCAHLVLTVAL